MEKVLERSEVKKEDTWDVESIYRSIKDWQEDYEDCRSKITNLEEQKDTLLLDNISNEQLRQKRDIVRQRSEGKNSLINLGD